METTKVGFICDWPLNWAKPDPSGNGTIFKDAFTLGHNLFERAFENNGTRLEMVFNYSKPNMNITKSASIQTVFDGKADISFGRHVMHDSSFRLVDFMFPVWVRDCFFWVAPKMNVKENLNVFQSSI